MKNTLRSLAAAGTAALVLTAPFSAAAQTIELACFPADEVATDLLNNRGEEFSGTLNTDFGAATVFSDPNDGSWSAALTPPPFPNTLCPFLEGNDFQNEVAGHPAYTPAP